jgi:hypothetical protein
MKGVNGCRSKPTYLWHHPHFRHREREGLVHSHFDQEFEKIDVVLMQGAWQTRSQ